ncbi:Arf-GAP with SH3 domain, ANK repeat and PH domain-containing protein 1 [Halotydeus destructor]|nr:Arf-GAP with SH3 domain, ANK repeat and PH domain-containing protein 1 [Halotydeus destructor]
MPPAMSISEFIIETKDDFSSPTTSTFACKMAQCRQTVSSLEESLDYDRDGLTKMKKALKAIFNGMNGHVDNEIYLSKALERLGANAMTKDQEPDIGAAFIKFSIVTKELSALMKTLMQNLNNVVMFPLDNILKGDLKGVKGDLKKPFDKAWRDYEAKFVKIEKEKRQQGFGRYDISSADIAEEMDKERKVFQMQMCEYLLKANEIKTKKGVELLSHLVEYYHAQTSYFQDGLKTIEHFNTYINELSAKVAIIKLRQDEERRSLMDLKNMLKSSASFLDGTSKDLNATLNTADRGNDKRDKGVYNLHQLQGNKHFGYSKSGYLNKKSEGKMSRVKVWQKRKCEVKDGFLYVFHSDESKAPAKVNLLTCQVKNISDEKRCFDLISCNRTYHFQAEDESETEAWVSVLINCKEGALKKEFDNSDAFANSQHKGDDGQRNQSLAELRQSIIGQVQKLPGNDKCVDCNSTKDPTWLSTNFGVLTCIECSGIHRDLGVHISRIQSLTLDNIGTSQLLLARLMSNNGFNDVSEAMLRQGEKPNLNSSMEQRYEYIRAKYVEHKYVFKSCSGNISDLKNDLESAVLTRHLPALLQAFFENADLNWVLPNAKNGETALHFAISHEDGSSMHIVDFLVQNSSDLNRLSKDGSTPLHFCVEQNQSECMKLLLRSGANATLKNAKGQTPLDLAKEKQAENIIELLEHALMNKKSMFENVNIVWDVPPTEDASTDFSDDDLTEDKLLSKYIPNWINTDSNSSVNQSGLGGMSSSGSSSFSKRRMRKLSLSSWERSNSIELLAYPNPILQHSQLGQMNSNGSQLERSNTIRSSRPSSVLESESPSSRSSDSFKRDQRGSTRRVSGQAAIAGAPVQLAMLQSQGSIKRKAPIVPKVITAEELRPSEFGLNNVAAHVRQTSEPVNMPTYAQIERKKSNATASGHLRNRSVDLVTSNVKNNNGGHISEGSKTIATTKYNSIGANNNFHQLQQSQAQPIYSSLQRPRVPPPPLPPHQNVKQVNSSNGLGREVPLIPAHGEVTPVNRLVPVPPPRKIYRNDFVYPSGKIRRCQALYDCDADRDDELAFAEGEVILIVNEKTDDDDWMEGVVEGQPERRGVFPSSFVHILPE